MVLVPVTDGVSDQTMPFITSQQCVKAAGVGAGAVDAELRVVH
jgi:hypothetical protein